MTSCVTCCVTGIIPRLELAYVGFSMYSTTVAIFGSRRPVYDQLTVLHGLRTLSIFWVFWGISYIFGPIANECWAGGVSPRVTIANTDLDPLFTSYVKLNYFSFMSSFLLLLKANAVTKIIELPQQVWFHVIINCHFYSDTFLVVR